MTEGAGLPPTSTSNLAALPCTAWQFLRPLTISGIVAAEQQNTSSLLHPCHVLCVSRPLCVTSSVCHVLCVSRPLCVTSSVCHVLCVSRPLCVTSSVCHVLCVSRPLCVTSSVCHVLCVLFVITSHCHDKS